MFVLAGELPKTYLEFRIWKQGRVNLDTLIVKLKSAVNQGMWDLVNEYFFLKIPLCREESEPYAYNDYIFSSLSCHEPTISRISTTEIQFLKSCRSKSSCSSKIKRLVPEMSRVARRLNVIQNNSIILPSSISASFNSVDNSLKNSNSSLSYTETTSANIARVDASLKNLENKTNIILNKYEKGEKGIVNDLYSNVLVKWFEYAISLNVPALKKCHVPLTFRHPVNICVRELQHIVTSIATDTSVKAFDLQTSQFNTSKSITIETYGPYNSATQMSIKCLLLGRNFDQWKISTYVDTPFDYSSWIDASLLKHYQKFSPLFISSENMFVPRQRLFLGIIACNEVCIKRGTTIYI